jgi:hypothetical protein
MRNGELKMSEKLFYMQDNRQYVGNDISWWAKSGAGYTTDVTKAEVWEERPAMLQNKRRESDVPWPKNYIDAHTRPVVDIQCVDYEIAMQV